MNCVYNPPISIHPGFLKKVKKVESKCGEEAANLFIQSIKELQKELILVKTEASLKEVIKKFYMINTLVLPKGYKNNKGYKSDKLFYEMPVVRLEGDEPERSYYYGRILLCFPFFFKESGTIEELGMFCEQIPEKVKNVNTAEIYFATYRGF